MIDGFLIIAVVVVVPALVVGLVTVGIELSGVTDWETIRRKWKEVRNERFE